MRNIGTNIFIETVYPGVNVGCIIIGEEAICVDTPLLSGEAQRWMARIRTLGAERVSFVVYTSGQCERVLGTQYLICDRQVHHVQRDPRPVHRISRLQRIPFARPLPTVTPEPSKSFCRAAVVAQTLAWEQVKEHDTRNFKQSMLDMYGDRDPDMINLEVILPQITFDACIKLYAGDVTVKLLSVARGIAWVWLREQRVLFAGDAVVMGTHPPLSAIDIEEWLTALERLQCEPRFQGAVVVPGRGPLCDTAATEPLMAYLSIARDKTRRVYRAGRPKAELNEVAAELLPLYPVADGQRERTQRHIKLALDGIYDEFKAGDAAVE